MTAGFLSPFRSDWLSVVLRQSHGVLVCSVVWVTSLVSVVKLEEF